MWTALAPLIIQVVLKLIDMLIDNADDRKKAKLSFLEFVKRDHNAYMDSIKIRNIYKKLLAEVENERN